MNSVSAIALPSNQNLFLSTSFVKTQLYQCWLQVYGPLFWIVSAFLCLCSTTPPRPAVTRQRTMMSHSNNNSNHNHRAIKEPVVEVRRPDRPVMVAPTTTTTTTHVAPKKSLRRSIKLHMQSFKHSLNEVVKRSLLRRHQHREAVHPLDKGSSTQTRPRRKSFGGYSQHPLFNRFRRKTAPELVHC
ncbi:hypothetical protein BJV82DRAFT_613257, partial [Fennellomyces sp. T-0311]